jgi:sugar phosphate isomerase/epimerase
MKRAIIAFSKPWPNLPIPDLARLFKSLGLDGAELVVRPGFQVSPDNAAKALPEAVRIFADQGLKIGAVAGSFDPAHYAPTLEAMGAAGVPIYRTLIPIDLNVGYRATVDATGRLYDSLIPVLERTGVALGVQTHSGLCIGSAAGLMHVIGKYDPRHVCAVWDPAHCSVDGEPEALAIDIVWSHLRQVNFKSACHLRVNAPNGDEAKWVTHWTSHENATHSWSLVVDLLTQRGFEGTMLVSPEYQRNDFSGAFMEGDETIPLLRGDIAYLKRLLGQSAA